MLVTPGYAALAPDQGTPTQGFFGSEILAGRDCFGSVIYAGIFRVAK